MKKNLFGALAILVCLVALGIAAFADSPNANSAAGNNAPETAQGGGGGIAVPIATGSGQTDGAGTEQILPGNFRYAYYICASGDAIKDGSESSCKPTKLWKQYGEEACSNFCAQNPTGSKECGGNHLASIKVYNECQAGNSATTEQVQSTTSTAAVLRKIPSNMNLDSEGLRQLVTKLVERLDYLEQRTNFLENRVSRLEKLLALTPQALPMPIPTTSSQGISTTPSNPGVIPPTVTGGSNIAIQSVSADTVVTNQARIMVQPFTTNTEIGVENGLPMVKNTSTQEKSFVPVEKIRDAVFNKMVKNQGIDWATKSNLGNELEINPKVNADGSVGYTVKYQVPNKTPILNWFTPTSTVEGTVTQAELETSSSASQPLTLIDSLYIENQSS
ncbi:MAG: hypothetical protein V1777_04230 [Candidatus Micrarchaeota archaeon]